MEVRRLPALPERPKDAHKGQFGHVLIVAGSPGMTGAGCMAAVAAQKAGAGLVTLALPESLNPIAEMKLTSAMSWPLPQPGAPVLGTEAAELVIGAEQRFDAVAVGPGVGRADETQQAVRMLVGRLERPVVVDADGLGALVGGAGALGSARGPRVLTPHPGEMARLLETTPAEVQSAREDAAVRFARKHNVLMALKGAGTVVTDGRRIYVNPSGNPGMATGGAGDVLTGLVAGLIGQGMELFDALQLGVFVHGLAGDLAARRVGMISMRAEDVLDCAADAFRLVAEAGADALPEQALELLG
ncbi:MAG: NAD(P)H-hydrate dehydratase [Planctomycetes bacterium]|nr:NAD(P)H-hydrate dehydratase [Planctomycetota bacterium]